MSSLSDDDMEGEVEGEVEDGVDEAEEEAAPGAELTRFNCKEVSWEWAAKRCVKSIEAGTGQWKCTNMTKTGATFQLSCATCHKNFSPNNPSNFWKAHRKKCTPVTRGQVLEPCHDDCVLLCKPHEAACVHCATVSSSVSYILVQHQDAVCSACWRSELT